MNRRRGRRANMSSWNPDRHTAGMQAAAKVTALISPATKSGYRVPGSVQNRKRVNEVIA
jgi:hypothetical protein